MLKGYTKKCVQKNNFIYIVVISTDGGMGEEVVHKMLEGRKVTGKMEGKCGRRT